MSAILFINPNHTELVERHRLDQFDDVMQRLASKSVRTRSQRGVSQIEVSDAGRTLRLFVKRDWRTQWKDRLQCWLDGFGWGTKARREFFALRALAQAGIGCPEVVVFAERGGISPSGYLILLEMPDAVVLSRYLAAERRRMSVPQRRALAAHLGREIARMHAAGIDHPDLFSKHVFLTAPADSSAELPCADSAAGQTIRLPDIRFIDFQRSRVSGPVSTSRRWRDLAALDSTLPAELAQATDRLAFLQSYLSQSRLEGDVRQSARCVRRRAQRLDRRAKVARMRERGQELALGIPWKKRSRKQCP